MNTRYCPKCGKELRLITQMHCHHVDRFYECILDCGYRFPSKCGYDDIETLEKYASKHIRALNEYDI